MAESEFSRRSRRIRQALRAGRADAVLTDAIRERFADHDLDRRTAAVVTWQGLLTQAMVQAVRTGTDAAMDTVRARSTEVELSYLVLFEMVTPMG